MEALDHGGRHGLAAKQWMDANPFGMMCFERFAMEAAKDGIKFGMKMVAERVRWEVRFSVYHSGRNKFKINNNHISYIARELLRWHPELDGLIEFRRVEADVIDRDNPRCETCRHWTRVGDSLPNLGRCCHPDWHGHMYFDHGNCCDHETE